jgi:hypothetical protein
MALIPAVAARNRFLAIQSAFERAGATDASSAKPLQEIGLEEDSVLRSMADRGLVREASPGRWYLDRDAAAEWLASRRRLAVLIAFLAMLVGAAMWFLQHRGH